MPILLNLVSLAGMVMWLCGKRLGPPIAIVSAGMAIVAMMQGGG